MDNNEKDDDKKIFQLDGLESEKKSHFRFFSIQQSIDYYHFIVKKRYEIIDRYILHDYMH